MRVPFPDLVEKGRVATGTYATGRGEPFGAFFLKHPAGEHLKVVASDGSYWAEHGLPGPPWEHVSVSHRDRCPTWAEMCFVKDLFFGPDEWVVQFHPARADYVDHHPHALHLWRVVGVEFPRPPKECV